MLTKKEKRKLRKLNKSLEGQQGKAFLITSDKIDEKIIESNDQNKTENSAVISQGRSSDGGELGGLVKLMSKVNAIDNEDKGNVLQTSAITDNLNPSALYDQKNNLKNLASSSNSQKPSKNSVVGSKSNDKKTEKEKRKLSDIPAPTPKRPKQEPIDNSKVDEALKVAIIDENNVEGIFEAKVWEKARASIYDAIRKHIRAHPDAASIPSYEFLGNQKGVKIVSCGDEMSLNFLKELVESLNFSEEGVHLKVIVRSKIPVFRRFKVSIPITSEEETFDDLRTMIQGMNRKIGSADWKFYIPKGKLETTVGGTRYLMFVGMPEDQVPRMKELNFQIHYGLEKLQLFELVENAKHEEPQGPTSKTDQMETDGAAEQT